MQYTDNMYTDIVITLSVLITELDGYIIIYTSYYYFVFKVLALWEENALLFIAINCNKFKYSNKQEMVASYNIPPIYKCISYC